MISDSTYLNLTGSSLAAILAPLSPHAAVRVSSRKNQQMPTKARLLHRLRFHMQKIIYGGRCLGSESSHGSVAMSTNPSNVHRQKFSSFSGVLKHSTEVNTMSQNNSAQNSEQTEPKTINDLHQSFADLCYSYGMLGRNISAEKNNDALEEIITDCKALADVSMALRVQAQGGAK